MSPGLQIVALGLVCWLLTVIVVDSELTRPIRTATQRWANEASVAKIRRHPAFGSWAREQGVDPCDSSWLSAQLDIALRTPKGWRDRFAYFVTCHLCAGIWVGLGLALVAGGPFHVPYVGWLLSGVLYKAVGHLVLAVQNVLEALATSLRPPVRFR